MPPNGRFGIRFEVFSTTNVDDACRDPKRGLFSRSVRRAPSVRAEHLLTPAAAPRRGGDSFPTRSSLHGLVIPTGSSPQDPVTPFSDRVEPPRPGHSDRVEPPRPGHPLFRPGRASTAWSFRPGRAPKTRSPPFPTGSSPQDPVTPLPSIGSSLQDPGHPSCPAASYRAVGFFIWFDPRAHRRARCTPRMPRLHSLSNSLTPMVSTT